MRIKIQKWGNSLALRIPKAFAFQSRIRQNEYVNLKLDNDKIVVEPIEEKKYNSDELLVGIKKSNLHKEIDFGKNWGRILIKTKYYVHDYGDIVWLTFNPQSGHEQSERRPALVLSPLKYNVKTNLPIFCPITNQIKEYPFEVILPYELEIKGVIESDQIKNFDWKTRKVEFICKLPKAQLNETLNKINALLNI